MVNHLFPIWVDEDYFPRGYDSVRAAVHPDFEHDSMYDLTLKPAWQDIEPYVVPDDPMDYIVGFAVVAIVVGGIAYFAGPWWALAFVAEPGTMTVSFFSGVVLSNWIQEQYREMD
jgi:hypothetical protein